MPTETSLEHKETPLDIYKDSLAGVVQTNNSTPCIAEQLFAKCLTHLALHKLDGLMAGFHNPSTFEVKGNWSVGVYPSSSSSLVASFFACPMMKNDKI